LLTITNPKFDKAKLYSKFVQWNLLRLNIVSDRVRFDIITIRLPCQPDQASELYNIYGHFIKKI